MLFFQKNALGVSSIGIEDVCVIKYTKLLLAYSAS